MMKKLNLILPPLILLPVIWGCGLFGPEKTTRGRIQYAITREHRNSGGHGWGSDKIVKREFYVNGRKWSPQAFVSGEFDGRCFASPNEAVEAFKCDGFSDKNEYTAVFRMNDDAPEWIKVWERSEISGRSVGEWSGDGRWLVFQDYLYNVETSEKREIKRLPGEPTFYFGALSPDVKTIVYMGIICSDGNELAADKTYKSVCEQRDEYKENRMEILWLIDADTGEAKHLEVSYDKYPWAAHPSIYSDDRLKEFQEKIVWAKDETGRDRLVFPN